MERNRKWLLFIAFGIASGFPVALAQTAAAGNTTPTFKPVPVWSVHKPDSRPRFLKKLTIESFGYGPAGMEPGFQLSPGYTASLFNLQGLECPACVLGPINRARFTLPPFGAKATLKLLNDRVELFGRAGAIEAWKPDNTFEPRGLSLWTSSYGDAWLTQFEAGGRVAVEPSQHLWFGASGRHLVNFGSGLKDWNTISGSATLEFGHH